MRGPSGSRGTSTTAVVAALVAVLAVMAFPGVGIGEPTTIEGGSPSAVYVSTNPDTCAVADVLGANPMPTAVTVEGASHLLVSFTSEWGRLDIREEGLLAFEILVGDNVVASTPFEWGVAGTRTTRTTATVTWAFDNVSAGDYTVRMSARVDATPAGGTEGGALSADLNECALTVSVVPA